MKTRMQNATMGQYSGLWAVAKDLLSGGGTVTSPATALDGAAPQPGAVHAPPSPTTLQKIFRFTAFFKGITPAFIRIGPHTVLLFIFKEQLTTYFGYKQTVPVAWRDIQTEISAEMDCQFRIVRNRLIVMPFTVSHRSFDDWHRCFWFYLSYFYGVFVDISSNERSHREYFFITMELFKWLIYPLSLCVLAEF